MSGEDVSSAEEHMKAFADRTGLTSDEPGRRYLWTDAFAVCNFVGLADETGDETYLGWARRLVDRVHERLGKYREDVDEEGWLSELSDEEAREHPTRGGLRIGKDEPQRKRGEPIDRDAEWDKDGQYFHYNTKWMHALDVMAHATGEPRYNRWARELAEVSHDAFTYTPSGAKRPRMYWKMRVDLSGPLVETMGQHDALDGFVTYRQLQMTAQEFSTSSDPDLSDAIERFEAMLLPERWSTDDPLGLGGLLLYAHREARIVSIQEASPSTLGSILSAARKGIQRFARRARLDRDADERLAFRELGLAIGMRAALDLQERVESGIEGFPEGTVQRRSLEKVAEKGVLSDDIVSFWEVDAHRDVDTWEEHRDINQVMLATATVPDGFVDLSEVRDGDSRRG